MADEYTPTTEDVRDGWGLWLAAHDREVAAKALRDAAVALRSHGVEHEPQANWLHDRAALIELQASEKGAGDGEQ